MDKVTASYNAEAKTMDVTFGGETRTFPAYCPRGDFACADKVFSCEFRNGKKFWPGEVTLWLESGKVSVIAGHSNKGGAHRLVGWWDASNSGNNSKGR